MNARAPKRSKDTSETTFIVQKPVMADQLVGHVVPDKKLRELWQKKRMPHAMLLTGPKGIGKATCMYQVIQHMFATASSHAQELSYIVKRMRAGSWLDMHVVESNEDGIITVETARDIGGFVSKTAAESAIRVVVIDGVETLTTNAANAILKLLEEPSPHVYFFLISHAFGKILPTIRSRCQVIPFAPLSLKEAEIILSSFLPSESLEVLQKLLLLSVNSPGVSLQYYQTGLVSWYEKFLNWLIEEVPSRGQQEELLTSEVAKLSAIEWQLLIRLWTRFGFLVEKQLVGIEETLSLSQEKQAVKLIATKHHFKDWSKIIEKNLELLQQTLTSHLDKKQVMSTILRMIRTPS